MAHTHVRFDATLDAHNGELEAVIAAAIATLDLPEHPVFGCHIPANGEDCEQGEITFDDHHYTRPIAEDDWFVIGMNAKHLAEEIRRLLDA